MPIYEYQCKACGHRLDALQKISDEPLLDCPECSDQALRRLISAPRFRLKGSGWYETDFKTGEKRNLADSGGSSESKNGDGDSKKSTADSKTESKPETAKPEKSKKTSSSGDGKAA